MNPHGRSRRAPGDELEVRVAYHVELDSEADEGAQISFESNDPRNPMAHLVFEVATIGRLRADPTILALPPGGTGVVTLGNVGDGDLELVEAPQLLDDPDGALSLELGADTQAGAVLAPGAQAAIRVHCSPDVAAPVRAKLVLATNDPQSPETTVRIRVDEPADPRLSVSPPELVFDAPPTWAPRSLTRTHTGTGGLLACHEVRIEPSAARDTFTLSGPEGEELEAQLTLAPGEETTVNVQVVAPAPSGVEAELVLFTNQLGPSDVHVPLRVPAFER